MIQVKNLKHGNALKIPKRLKFGNPKHIELAQKGSRKLRVGDDFPHCGKTAKVIAIAGNWAMCRIPHAMPFCLTVKEILQKF